MQTPPFPPKARSETLRRADALREEAERVRANDPLLAERLDAIVAKLTLRAAVRADDRERWPRRPRSAASVEHGPAAEAEADHV